jgi:hypothetical protein
MIYCDFRRAVGCRLGGILDQDLSARSLRRVQETDDGLLVVTLKPSNLLACVFVVRRWRLFSTLQLLRNGC